MGDINTTPTYRTMKLGFAFLAFLAIVVVATAGEEEFAAVEQMQDQQLPAHSSHKHHAVAHHTQHKTAHHEKAHHKGKVAVLTEAKAMRYRRYKRYARRRYRRYARRRYRRYIRRRYRRYVRRHYRRYVRRRYVNYRRRRWRRRRYVHAIHGARRRRQHSSSLLEMDYWKGKYVPAIQVQVGVGNGRKIHIYCKVKVCPHGAKGHLGYWRRNGVFTIYHHGPHTGCAFKWKEYYNYISMPWWTVRAWHSQNKTPYMYFCMGGGAYI